MPSKETSGGLECTGAYLDDKETYRTYVYILCSVSIWRRCKYSIAKTDLTGLHQQSGRQGQGPALIDIRKVEDELDPVSSFHK